MLEKIVERTAYPFFIFCLVSFIASVISAYIDILPYICGAVVVGIVEGRKQ